YNFFFSSSRRHTIFSRDWSSDVCSSDLKVFTGVLDGNFKTISNLTIEGTQDRVGIWYGLRGTVKNIEFINAAISSTAAARAGLRSEERRVGKEIRYS